MFLNLITKEVFQFDYVHPEIDKTYGFPHTVHMLHVNPDNERYTCTHFNSYTYMSQRTVMK